MAGIYSQGGSAGHRYAGWLSKVEAKNFQFGGKVFNGSPSAIYVGSNLVWAPWLLKDAAIRAILGAFGQRDGWAVINATNAYLNQLAASDRDKATALADYLNSSPENCLGYINQRYIISQTSNKDLLYVYEHAMAINIAVYGGTSAAVSRMQITIDGTLVYNKLQSETAYGGTNSGGVDVSNVINTARMNSSSDWWRVSSRAYVAYNNTCYTDWKQILHIGRLNTRQEFDLVGMPTPPTP
jgi:hypothetical protein